MQAAFVAAVLFALGSIAVRRALALELGWAWIALGGTVVGLAVESRIEPALVWGIGLLIAGAVVARRRRRVWSAALALPGAAALAVALPHAASWWMCVALVVAVAFVVPVAAITERVVPAWAMPALVLGSAWGVFVCVPETGPVHSLLGALVPATVFGVLMRWVPAPVALAPLVGLLLWSAAAGGATRPGAVVGGLACVGVLVLVPLAPRAPIVLVFAVDAGLVLFVARVAGFRSDAGAAALLTMGAYAVAVALLVLGQRLAGGRVDVVVNP